MRYFILLAVCWALFIVGGCTSWYTSKTEVEIPVVSKDGVLMGIARYKSDKDQVDFSADYDPATGKVHVETGKASTPEQAIIESAKTTQQALGILGAAIKAAPVP